ncbi:MAG: YidC/Oxa1 family insertase periplasmic-domain containing protein [Planctomycetales bacterium]|nr:YidC/Oxa1 family insertase periplasmic-domain containing protein [Planctomycetales bacterium]
MEKRYVLFVLLSAVILFGYLSIASLFAPPEVEVAEQTFDDQSPLDVPADGGESSKSRSEASDDSDATTGTDDASTVAETAPEVRADRAESERWTTLGTGAGEPIPMLVTFTNRGAAVERIELTARAPNGNLRFRDVFAEDGYLGHLALRETQRGVEIGVVGDGTPAALAKGTDDASLRGLQAGDVITEFNGTAVDSSVQFNQLLQLTKPGDEVTITVSRPSAATTENGADNGPDNSAGEDANEPSDTPEVSPRILKFAVVLGEHPLEIIAPEVESDATQLVTDPASLMMTIAKLGEAQGKLVSFDDETRRRWKALDEVVWEMHPLEAPLIGVEFRYRLTSDDLNSVGLSGSWQIVKRYSLATIPQPESDGQEEMPYHLQLDIALKNLGEQPQRIAFRLAGPNGLPTEGWWYQNKIHPQMMASAGARDVIWESLGEGHRLLGGPKIYSNARENQEDDKPIVTSIASTTDPEDRRTISNVGVDTQYFVVSLIPGTLGDRQPMLVDELVAYPVAGVLEIPKAKIRAANVSFAIVSPTYTVAPNEEVKQSFVVFAGPKDPDVLAAYDLSESIEYGWGIFELFARPLMAILHIFYRITHNYGLAIIMLTVLVRACMTPVSRKAAKSAAKMQELAPELKKISEKYKDDLVKQRQAQQELYRKHNFNPFGSCLLMFFQLPVFIGLYRCLSIDLELRQAPLIPGIRWASNLAAPDMLFRWDTFMPEFIAGEGTGWLGPYFNILPVVTICLFLAQQKMFTPPPTDDQQKAQQQMMTFMMIFMGVLFFRVPSGLCVYFIVSSIWGIAERKLLPKPTPGGQAEPAPAKKGWLATLLDKAAENGSASTSTAEQRKKRQQKRR